MFLCVPFLNSAVCLIYLQLSLSFNTPVFLLIMCFLIYLALVEHAGAALVTHYRATRKRKRSQNGSQTLFRMFGPYTVDTQREAV